MCEIFVRLLRDGHPLYRPVAAKHVRDDIYEISGSIPDGETWEFQPGQQVECEEDVLFAGGYGMFARRAASTDRPDTSNEILEVRGTTRKTTLGEAAGKPKTWWIITAAGFVLWLGAAAVFSSLCLSFGGGSPSCSDTPYPDVVVVLALFWFVTGMPAVPLSLLITVAVTFAGKGKKE